jgi:hypothetical protein
MFQVGTACYGTATQAAQVSASAQVGAVVSHGGMAYTVDVVAAGDTAITYALHPLGGGASLQTVVGYTPQPCNLLQAEDGITIGWLVAGAWIAAFGLMFLARAIRGETGENYGNS